MNLSVIESPPVNENGLRRRVTSCSLCGRWRARDIFSRCHGLGNEFGLFQSEMSADDTLAARSHAATPPGPRLGRALRKISTDSTGTLYPQWVKDTFVQKMKEGRETHSLIQVVF